MGSHSTNSAVAGPVALGESGRSAGGSSGGSAVAVLLGDADVALGTDTGGSVRLPAAYAGVVGFKPSYGMISRHGVVPYANSLDTVGFLAKDVGTIARLVVEGGLCAEHDPMDPTSLSAEARRRCSNARDGYQAATAKAEGEPQAKSLSGLTFGLPLEYNIEELEPCIRDAWAATATKLQELGARVVPVSLPSTRHALSAYYVIAPAEASSNLAKYDGVRYGTRNSSSPSESDASADSVLYAATRGRGFGDEVKRRILLGSYTLSSEAMDNYFVQAQRVRRLVGRDFDRVFALPNPLRSEQEQEEPFDLSDIPEDVPLESKLGPAQVDFLLCPTAPTLPPRLEDVARQTPVDTYMNDVFTVPASLAGLPAISVPVPVARGEGAEADSPGYAGMQLIGQYWDDARLLAAAEALSETAVD